MSEAIAPGEDRPFRLEEATIEDLHRAIRSGATTCVEVVQQYIDRARAYNGVCSALMTEDGAPGRPRRPAPSAPAQPLQLPHRDRRRRHPAARPGQVRGPAARVRSDGGDRLGSRACSSSSA